MQLWLERGASTTVLFDEKDADLYHVRPAAKEIQDIGGPQAQKRLLSVMAIAPRLGML